MLILDKAKIGDSVQVNLELSKDRLTKEIIDAINVSSKGKISDFKITDGKGIGVVLQLSNGKEQWFFEDEIYLIDENGNVINKINDTKENNSLVFDNFKTTPIPLPSVILKSLILPSEETLIASIISLVSLSCDSSKFT